MMLRIIILITVFYFFPSQEIMFLLIQESCASYTIIGSTPKFFYSVKLQWPSLAFFGSKYKIYDFERPYEQKVILILSTKWAFTSLKLTIEILEQGVKYIQNFWCLYC